MKWAPSRTHPRLPVGTTLRMRSADYFVPAHPLHRPHPRSTSHHQQFGRNRARMSVATQVGKDREAYIPTLSMPRHWSRLSRPGLSALRKYGSTEVRTGYSGCNPAVDWG